MGTLEEQMKALKRQQAEVQAWEEEVIKRIGAVEKREWDVARKEKEIEAKMMEMKERKGDEGVKEWEREGEEEEAELGGFMRVSSRREERAGLGGASNAKGSEVTMKDVTADKSQTNSSATVEIMKGVTLVKAGKGKSGAGAAARAGGREGAGGGGGRGVRHDVMEALQMLKLGVRALQENVETVLHTESRVEAHQMLKLGLRALQENVETVLHTESSPYPHGLNTTRVQHSCTDDTNPPLSLFPSQPISSCLQHGCIVASRHQWHYPSPFCASSSRLPILRPPVLPASTLTPSTRVQHSCTSHWALGLHPHAFNASAAFLHLPPGSTETATPPAAAGAAAKAAAAAAAATAAAAAAAGPEGSHAAAAAAPKAPEPPKQFVRPAVERPLVIAGMVYNRVFDGDYTRFWALHVWQWLEYHRYAGVTKFYWYDEARSTDEDQDVVLAPYIDAGLVVYHRVRELPFVGGNFTEYLERMFRCKQGAAYNHWVKQYASEVHWAFHTNIGDLFPSSTSEIYSLPSPLTLFPSRFPSAQHYASEVHWAFHTDIDEYFFSPAGTPPGFLRHYLQTLPNTTIQVLVQNMFFLGDPIGPDTDTLLERYTLRMPNSSERHRTKPIGWLPLAVNLTDDCINPHEWPMLENGPPRLVDTEILRLNHYWGDRAGVISDITPVYTMDVTMMDEYGDGLVKDDSAKPMGVWLRQRMQVAWAFISAQAVHKERERLRKRVAEAAVAVAPAVPVGAADSTGGAADSTRGVANAARGTSTREARRADSLPAVAVAPPAHDAADVGTRKTSSSLELGAGRGDERSDVRVGVSAAVTAVVDESRNGYEKGKMSATGMSAGGAATGFSGGGESRGIAANEAGYDARKMRLGQQHELLHGERTDDSFFKED
ncbi:unnamed protein product [Closterium sp. Yama58-4]|nr:unnamed protein product [Closterium sp. Yama58-4]